MIDACDGCLLWILVMDAESDVPKKMYKLVFFVPESHLELVKEAVFQKGAGRIGNYDSCCWQVKGVGQFRPLDGADPYIGGVGAVASVEEYRVELVCERDCIRAVVEALKAAHPYEEPAYDVCALAVIENL